MKHVMAIVLVALFSLPVVAQTAQLKSLPGYVDLADLDEAYGEPRVMVNIGGSLLRLMTAAASAEEPEVADMIRGLKGVRIKVYPTGGNLDPALEKVREARASLEADPFVKAMRNEFDATIVPESVRAVGQNDAK